jgi:hypothetical protein
VKSEPLFKKQKLAFRKVPIETGTKNWLKATF